jgi:hypothetical protein
VDEVAEAMMHLAAVLNSQLDEFVSLYDPPKPVDEEEVARRAAEQADMEFFRNWGRK